MKERALLSQQRLDRYLHIGGGQASAAQSWRAALAGNVPDVAYMVMPIWAILSRSGERVLGNSFDLS